MNDAVVTPRVAVLGLGIMGTAMAERLLDSGFVVDAWNRSPEPVEQLALRGAVPHTAAADAAGAADVVITMLPTGDVVDEVMLRGDVVDALRPRSTWAQMGTIGAAWTDRLVAQVASRRPDAVFVDAPVSGSRQPARSGHLVILASGPEDGHTAVQPVFDALGQRTVWLGAAGKGSRMKLVLNTWLAFETETAAEVSNLAAQLRVAHATLVDVAQGVPLASAYALAKLNKMASGDDSPEFPLEWALKDLTLALGSAPEQALPVAGAIAGRWTSLVEGGLGRLDVSAAHQGFPPLTP